jgi:hypothetical protein
MPDVRDQDTAASPSKLGLYSLDEVPADALASRALRDDQGRIGPITVPKPRLRLHQPPDGRKIFASGFSNHARHLARIIRERANG